MVAQLSPDPREILAKFKRLTPNHVYAAAFAIIAVGTFGTQTGLVSLPFIKGPPPPFQGPVLSPSREFRAFRAQKLKTRFDELDYSFDTVCENNAAVPRLFVSQLPDDLSDVGSLKERKELFLLAVLPLVLRANERLANDRARLIRMRTQLDGKKSLSGPDSDWLMEMEHLYSVQTRNLSALTSRVDEIPVSLALAQAAIESGWGTSRFAMQGNALFGQWTKIRDVRGLSPTERSGEKSHRVRAFSKLFRSVWKYALNLNTHPAYREFRQARKASRRAGIPLSGDILAGTLSSYSERGTLYTEELRTIIHVNRLDELDDAKLSDAPSAS